MGCAISAICAPNYGNVFMGKFERTYIYPLSAIAGSLTMAKFQSTGVCHSFCSCTAGSTDIGGSHN